MSVIGNVGSPLRATVDGRGLVTPWPGGPALDWWIGAEDRWHRPAAEPAVRQSLMEGAPVVETAMRIPGGEAICRAYAVADSGGVVVVEVENRSATPVAAAFVRSGRRPGLVLPRRPSEVKHESGCVAFIFPLPHRASLRAAMPLRRGRRWRPMPAFDVGGLPGPEAVARGWAAVLRRGPRLVLPDARLQAAVDANRAYELMAPAVEAGPGGADHVATSGAQRVGAGPAGWRQLREMLDAASPTWTWPEGEPGPVAFLGAVRRLVVEDGPDGIALCPTFPPEWMGADLEGHDIPTAHGPVSFVLRWHGRRPALFWEAEREGIRLCAPGLDATWATTVRTGEALLGPYRERVNVPVLEAE